MKKIRRRTGIKRPNNTSNLRPLWSESDRPYRRNLIGWYDIERGTVFTKNFVPSLPGGTDELRNVLIMIGKRKPTKSFYERLAAKNRAETMAR